MRLTTLFLAVVAFASAQQMDNQERKLNCSDAHNSRNDERASHCEMKEFTIPGTRAIVVDGGRNGGVQVKGWNRSEVLVRAQVQTWAPLGGDPRAMVSQIQIQTAGGNISANAPDFGQKHGWGISYEVFVPQRTDLSLKANNGGISIHDVTGEIQFDTTNGGVKLERLAGNVRGKTRNGGLSVDLSGDRWQGQEFRAETTNGGVNISLPREYSAQLETGTVNGKLSLDVPLPNGLDSTREVSVRVGAGGPVVRATTVNGGVVVKRKS
jgi:hypothetical protein